MHYTDYAYAQLIIAVILALGWGLIAWQVIEMIRELRRRLDRHGNKS